MSTPTSPEPTSPEPAADSRETGTYQDLIESQRRTWEMELLISGAVVFALFQIPTALDNGFDRFLLALSETQRFATFFGYVYLKMIVLVLIAAFLLHLGTRAFWVGLIGLRSVYPEGIDWSEVHDGPMWQEVLREMPSLGGLAEATDRLASRIFSFAFIFVILFLASIFYIAVFVGLSLFLSTKVFKGVDTQQIALVLAILFALPSTIFGLADKSYKRRGLEPPESMKRLTVPILRFYHHAFLGSIAKPMLYTFTSNLKRRRAYPLLVAAFMVLYFGLFGQLILRGSDRSMLHGYKYLPPRDGELSVRDRYYENLREAGPVNARYPSLSSDVVEGPYLKLFLPYVPREDNPTLEARCPEQSPWPLKLKRPKENPSRSEEEGAIQCLSRLYQLELDGQALAPEFHLYRHPQTGMRGLLAYLATHDLIPGRHTIRIVETDIDRENPVVHHLPFWR